MPSSFEQCTNNVYNDRPGGIMGAPDRQGSKNTALLRGQGHHFLVLHFSFGLSTTCAWPGSSWTSAVQATISALRGDAFTFCAPCPSIQERFLDDTAALVTLSPFALPLLCAPPSPSLMCPALSSSFGCTSCCGCAVLLALMCTIQVVERQSHLQGKPTG